MRCTRSYLFNLCLNYYLFYFLNVSMDALTFPDVVELNVGGKLMTTLLSTLTKDPGSMLAAMFSGRHVISKDKDGRFFIDCDGSLFEYILNFLRFGTLTSKEKALELYDIAVYFNLQSLVRSVESSRAVQYRRGIEEMRNKLDMQEYEGLKKDAIEQLYKCCARPEDDIIVLFLSQRNVCSSDCFGSTAVTSVNIRFKHAILLKVNAAYDTEIRKDIKLCLAHDINELGFGKYVYTDKSAEYLCQRCGNDLYYCNQTALLVAYKVIENAKEESKVYNYV